MHLFHRKPSIDDVKINDYTTLSLLVGLFLEDWRDKIPTNDERITKLLESLCEVN
jgi:hypothetical protein